MSSAYSSPANFGKNVSVLDVVQLTGTVGAALSQRYDANVAKVDSLIQQYTSVPLVRSQDKHYLGERLQTLLSAVDRNSKINWTSGTAARDVNAQIAAAVDDHVLKQMSNSQSIINFEQTAAQKKAKGDGTYNDINYIYAKDKAGYEDYMRGVDKNGNKVDDIGSLQYMDYYDVNKNLTEDVEKFAKERGYEKVIDTESQEGVVFKTVKGKVLSPEEISAFVTLKIDSDPRLKQQLIMNSHAEYRGFSDEEIHQRYTEFANSQAAKVDDQLATIESEKKNTNKDDVAKLQALDAGMNALITKKSNILAQVEPKNFNRDAVQYKTYTENLVNQYAKTYSVNDITDIKYDDYWIKLQKAQGKLTEEGTPKTATSVQGVGQIYEQARSTTPTEEAPDDLTEFETNRKKAWDDMTGHIRSQLRAEGKDSSAKAIADYYQGLKKAAKEGVDINAQGYNAEDIALYNQVELHNKRAFNMTKVASEEYSKASEEVLEGFFGGKGKDLDIQGLATTMPHTASLLTKYGSIDQVPKKDREMAFYEIATNAKNTLDLDDIDKKRLNLYLTDLERKNSFSKDALKQNVKSEEERGFFDGLTDVAKGAFKWGTGYILPTIGTALTTFRTGEKQKAYQEQKKAFAEGAEQTARGLRAIDRGVFGAFTEDRDLSDIQSDDISLSGYGTPRERFANVAKNVREKISLQSEAYKANAPKHSALLLNPEIKADKPYVELTRSAIIANGGRPSANTTINITDIKDNKAYIQYEEEVLVPKEKGGQTKELITKTVAVPVSNLPKNLLAGIQTNLTDFEFSVKNPTPMEVKFNYSPPNDLDSRIELAEKYLKNNANYMSESQINMLQVDGFSDIKTKEDYIKENADLPANYLQALNADVNSQYSLQWKRPAGGGVFLGTLIKDGKAVKDRIPLEQDFNPHAYQLSTIKIINGYLDERVKELKSLYNRTRL